MTDCLQQRLSFAVAGAQKCGTTTLDSWLREHPQIDMGRVKESHFFDSESGIDWNAPDYSRLHGAYDHDGRIRGEATPITLFWPSAQSRMYAYNPDMKLVVLVRDPAERAFSQWRMSRRNGWEPLDFAEAIRGGRRRLAEQGPVSMAARRFSYVERGFYARQLKGLAGLFGWDRILVLDQADMAAHPGAVFQRVTGFLGVDAMTPPHARRLNAAPEDDESLSSDDRAYLDDLYRADLAELAELTGVRLRP